MNAALVLTIGLAGIGPEGSSLTARELLQAMRDRYDGKWYRSLTFVQGNTQTRPDGTIDHSTWRDWLAMPGRLRIEFMPSDSGAGMLFTADSHYVFRADSMVTARPFVHPLLVLSFDVYFHPVERTVALLERHGFDLSMIHEDTWAGRPVYVVGARAGDVHTRQFWIDRERLVFVRMLEPAPGDS
ncbi:MAG: hypothetical protein ACREMV_09495, partial [Gemmatimonadales bacterium]